jgi:hypothetical protein
MFQTKVVEKIKSHSLCRINFPKIVPFLRYVEKCGRAGHATDGDIKRRRKDAVCIPDK